jgi:BirA family biotin operon repressor/biotin-[acetyl-CoA-carboxylase] ligase
MTDWPAGVGREVCAELDSTNAEALRRAAAGARGPLWLLALRQTTGRGRRGRGWSAAGGNLAATYLLSTPGGPAQAALRSFTAALGLFDALVLATGRPQLFTLKWPNDVLLSGGKLAGILLESGGPRGGVLAIGIGVNLAHAPAPSDVEPNALAPVSLAEATGIAIGPEEFLDLLAPSVQHWEDRLSAQGFEPIRSAWLARAARLGETVTARLPGREIAGVFETIDPSGAIVLAAASGRVALPAAEIHFGPVEAPHAAGH